ncbi:hypothetical protein JTB14_003156 [Gonioctena quinquepunctata]|nr:hypothetical protein JTB14_003156 [Gonioctena quinquepunctata]
MGFARSLSNSSHSERSYKICSSEDRYLRNWSHVNSVNKKHDCTNTPKTKRSASLPPRPTTRRNPYEMPQKLQSKSISQPAVGLPRKHFHFTKSEGRNSKSRRSGQRDNISMDSLASNIISRSSTASSKSNRRCQSDGENALKIINMGKQNAEIKFQNDSFDMENGDDKKRTNYNNNKSPAATNHSNSRVEEHEYLQFLLRITEDIIVNNYFRNKDIEKVFENHMEINKERLDMEKMKENVAELASELSIPYKDEGFCSNKGSPAKLVVSPLPILSIGPLQNCSECSMQLVLDLPIQISGSGENYVYGKDIYKPSDSEEILINRHSLGRVTECTEPTNSIETILSPSTKYNSRATVSTFPSIGNVEIQFLENMEKLVDDSNLVKRVPADENFNIEKNDGISLTGKERKNSTEEEIIFAKLKESQNEENPVEATLEMENFKKSCDSSDDLLFQNNAKISIYNGSKQYQAELPPLNAPKIEEKKRNKNKCTQTTVLKCDRECETNEAENNQEYVLIDCPVFVLKSSLGTFEKLVIAKFQDSSEKVRDPFLKVINTLKEEFGFVYTV